MEISDDHCRLDSRLRRDRICRAAPAGEARCRRNGDARRVPSIPILGLLVIGLLDPETIYSGRGWIGSGWFLVFIAAVTSYVLALITYVVYALGYVTGMFVEHWIGIVRSRSTKANARKG